MCTWALGWVWGQAGWWACAWPWAQPWGAGPESALGRMQLPASPWLGWLPLLGGVPCDSSVLPPSGGSPGATSVSGVVRSSARAVQ
jgi:hypothetical protein